jgi:hypothetical protein
MGTGSIVINRLLAACSPAPVVTTAPAVQTPAASQRPGSATPPATQTAPAVPTGKSSTQPAPAITPAGIPDLVVGRGGEPEALVRLALGGMERFVARGANVVVKPNICVAYHTYEYAATSNPRVVGTGVKMCVLKPGPTASR